MCGWTLTVHTTVGSMQYTQGSAPQPHPATYKQRPETTDTTEPPPPLYTGGPQAAKVTSLITAPKTCLPSCVRTSSSCSSFTGSQLHVLSSSSQTCSIVTASFCTIGTLSPNPRLSNSTLRSRLQKEQQHVLPDCTATQNLSTDALRMLLIQPLVL